MHSVVIGGSQGLGKEVTAEMERRGDIVSSLSRRELPSLDLENEKTWNACLDHIRIKGSWDNLIFTQRYREGRDPERELAVGISALSRLVDRFLNYVEKKGGSIVVVGSPAATLIASEQPLEYHMAKAALLQWARYSAVSLGSRGVRVNVVTPSRIDRGDTNPKLLRSTPLKRLATDRDLAEVIGFLCSPASGMVTGQEIVVDGGLSLVAPSNLILEQTT